ncbi:MAG TPA: hypothetical protein VMF61_10545, partial [Candidatus Acidoferrales bacterium]|nr:hypothetical protein [Candidatus Acidoferrales bacterium]
MIATSNATKTPAALVDLLASARGLDGAATRLEALRRLAHSTGGGSRLPAVALHETVAAARPALLASLWRRLRGTMLIVSATPDASERAFADLLYYLGEDAEPTLALARSRDEALGALDGPSERSART